jgi:hypothetical protein
MNEWAPTSRLGNMNLEKPETGKTDECSKCDSDLCPK